MSALSKFDENTHKSLASSLIKRVFETKIYHIFRGRNAWHSTWVEHYFEGCMHADLQSAMDQVEAMRKPGSVFTIEQMPAISFQSAKGQSLVTEIDNPVPLSLWAKTKRGKSTEHRLNQDCCRLEQFMSKLRRIHSIFNALGDSSVFIGRLPYYSEKIFVLGTLNAISPGEDCGRRFKQWESSSVGANFFLKWSENTANLSGKAVRQVADALNERVAGLARPVTLLSSQQNSDVNSTV